MKTLKSGLIGLVLGVAVAMGTATVGSEEAAAAVCCSYCEVDTERCVAGCGEDVTCEMYCYRANGYCGSICDSSC
ncbi:hypothetical protein ACLESD_13320 [Pyxidicoccus sp. 3LFB2]